MNAAWNDARLLAERVQPAGGVGTSLLVPMKATSKSPAWAVAGTVKANEAPEAE